VKGFWWPPGGRVFKGETLYSAAKRKLKEETGVLAEPLGVLGVWNTFFNSSSWGQAQTHTINVVVHLRLKSSEIVLDETSEEHCWISPAEAGRYDPYVQEIMRAVQSGIAL
jgi:ADP-ribose pyrophosphatase YjhB (NUDIX family)